MVLARFAPQLFTLFSWLLALAWLRLALGALRGMPTLPDLTRLDVVALPELNVDEAPHLTVIVPACNEQESIQANLRSLLASTGLQVEVIAVDDRSTDQTGKLMDEVAAEAAAGGGANRLRVLHISELPAGWLGKPHALALAARQASAPWLLFTDGDVIFHPQALELSLRCAMAQNADHLVLLPTLILKTAGEAAMVSAFSVLGQWSGRPWKVADPRAREFAGVGGFNLIRREVYMRLGGFEALRMEVVDDLRLGWLVKRAGYAQRVAVGPGLIRIRWLQGVFAVVSLTEKNAFAVFRYRVGLTLLACLALAGMVVWPLAAMAAGGWALAAGLLTYASIAMAYGANRRATQVSPWYAVFFAPAVAIVLFATLRSMALTLLHNGVDWRGTHYPLAELRRHAGRGW
jgi:glycosyltransferase involved in cell wall biosynthesis